MTRRSERLDRLELAHLLRTPLTAALLAAGVLEGEAIGPLNEAQREAVSSIAGELARLRRLVEQGLRTETLGAYAGPLAGRTSSLARLIRDIVEAHGGRVTAHALERGGSRLSVELPEAGRDPGGERRRG